MRTPRSTVARLGVILAAALAAAPSEAQTTFTLVHSLAPGVVNSPVGLVMDEKGNLYGTNRWGGANGFGSVYKIRNGLFWTLHSFVDPATGTFEGSRPEDLVYVPPVPGETCGTLYGLTVEGGTHNSGTVFKISTDDSGADFQTIHDFDPTYQHQEGNSQGGLTLIGSDLFITASNGGADVVGAILKLPTTAVRGDSSLSFVGSFLPSPAPNEPFYRVVPDGAGNLLGIALLGGTNAWGAVYKMSISTGNVTELHAFDGSTYVIPYGAPVFDGVDTLFGVFNSGGATDFGALYKLQGLSTPTPTFSIIHDFPGGFLDGAYPSSLVLGGPAGAPTLIGVAQLGGSSNAGTVFSLPANATTATGITLIHSFASGPTDAVDPSPAFLLDGPGNLFGVANSGGANGAGAVYKISTPGGFGTGSGGTGGTGDGNCIVFCTPPPTPQASNNGPVCAGSTIQLSTPNVAGATYFWSGPNGYTSNVRNPTISNATPAMTGDYLVTVTVGGCSSAPGTTTVVVNQPATPVAANTGPYCQGSTISLSTPTVAGVSYAWTGPKGFSSNVRNPTISNATPAMTGDYFVTVTDAMGCSSAPGTTTVVVNPTPSTPIPTNSGPYCEGATIQLSTPTVAGASYGWSGPNGFSSTVENPTIPGATIAMAGDYVVTVTVNGCTPASGKTTVVVNLCKPTPMPTVVTSPVAGAGSPNRLAKVALHAGSTYDWTISNGTITSGLGTNAIVFTAGNPGPLTLSVVERDPAFSNIPSLPGTARVDVLQRGFATQAYTVSPCRLLDTRNASSKDGLGGPPLGPDERRLFTPSLSSCGVPSTAAALLVNVTVVRPSALGDLVVWGDGTPGGEPRTPLMHFSSGLTRALMTGIWLPRDSFWIHNESTGNTDVIVDVFGYFE